MTREKRTIREASNIYHKDVLIGMRDRVDDMMNESWHEWNQNRSSLIIKDENMWHPLLKALRTQYTQYYREVEMH